MRPQLQRRSTLAELGMVLRKCEHESVEAVRDLVNAVEALSRTGQPIDVQQGQSSSPPLRRRKSQRRALLRTVDALEQVPKRRTPSLHAALQLSIERLKSYEACDAQLRSRLDALLSGEVRTSLDRAILEALISGRCEALRNFELACWDQRTIEMLFLYDGKLHALSRPFAKQLMPYFCSDHETPEQRFRVDGPASYLLKALFNEDALDRRIRAELTLHGADQGKLLRALLKHMRRAETLDFMEVFETDPETLIVGAFLRVFLPALMRTDVPMQLIQTGIRSIPRTSRQYSKLFDRLCQ